MGSGWLRALEVRGLQAFLPFLAFALVSVGHDRRWLSLGELPGWIAAAANTLMILFGVLALPWLFSLAWQPIGRARSRTARRERIEQQLASLTVEEALIFWDMILDGRRSDFGNVGLWRPSPGHQGLVRRGLLTVQAMVGEGASLWMPDSVWEAALPLREQAREELPKLQQRITEDRW